MNTKDEIRLGFIYPAGTGDQEYYRFADQVAAGLQILMLSTRLWGDDRDHDIDCLLKTGDVGQLAGAAEKFEQLAPDSVMWACTSASFVGGTEWARDQVRAIESACGAPAGGTSLAITEGLRKLEIERVAIMATVRVSRQASPATVETGRDFYFVRAENKIPPRQLRLRLQGRRAGIP